MMMVRIVTATHYSKPVAVIDQIDISCGNLDTFNLPIRFLKLLVRVSCFSKIRKLQGYERNILSSNLFE